MRTDAIQSATLIAMEIPFKVMQTAFNSMEVIRQMAIEGNPNSVSDAGVAVLCARSAVMGAFMNVRINASGYHDRHYVSELITKGKNMESAAIALEAEILDIVNKKIGG